MKLLAMFFCLNPVKFFANMPATLSDIESEIYALLFQSIGFKVSSVP